MRRYEILAEKILSDLDVTHLGPLLASLQDKELVALLAGSSGTTHEHRYLRDIVATELNNRLDGQRGLLEMSLLPSGGVDFLPFTQAIARALRADMSCLDAVDGAFFVLHGKNEVPPELDATVRCRHSSMALCKQVLLTGEPLAIPDIPGDPRFCEVPAWKKFGMRAYAGAPGFDTEGKVNNVVWVGSYRARPFPPEEILLLERVAQRIASEIGAAHLSPSDVLQGTLPAPPVGP